MNKVIRIKPGCKMKCKAKNFTNLESVGNYPIDRYPEKDKYIPEAMMMADAAMVKTGVVDEKGKATRLGQDWSNAFTEAMNTILSEKGLRVL